MRQFALSPAHIHFGNVAVGNVAHAHARLRNISTGPARFTVVGMAFSFRFLAHAHARLHNISTARFTVVGMAPSLF